MEKEKKQLMGRENSFHFPEKDHQTLHRAGWYLRAISPIAVAMSY
jgi:hypothetical protein